MEGGFNNPGNSVGGSPKPNLSVDPRTAEQFQLRLAEAQTILNQNTLLINEINQNHQSGVPEYMRRNVTLITELNNNLRRITDIYATLPGYLISSMEGDSTSETSSSRGSSRKRPRQE